MTPDRAREILADACKGSEYEATLRNPNAIGHLFFWQELALKAILRAAAEVREECASFLCDHCAVNTPFENEEFHDWFENGRKVGRIKCSAHAFLSAIRSPSPSSKGTG
jgi:hypothetical protein